MGFDSPDHHHHSQEFLVDCGYTKVIASRVGALGISVVRAAKPGDFTRAKRKKPPRDESSVPRFPQGKLREFTLADLEKATANFSDKRLLGQGGFGKVFKGILSDGAVVAVKVLDNDSEQGPEQFQTEMRISCAIMGISYPNLVPAIGYHSSRNSETVQIMIVYPFMANRDVHRYLGDFQPSSLTPLDWKTRKRITLGVARGICILHELGIVHHDIKPSNVLLDEDFSAHVGDLGLAGFMSLSHNSHNAARFHGEEDSLRYSTKNCGTFGYVAPELYSTYCRASRKSDVYAFGTTLIQLVTGMPSVIRLEEATHHPHIVYRAEQLLKNKEGLTRLMHPGMLGMYDESEAIELIRVGLVCAQYDPEKRPLMPEVIAMMEGSSANLKQRWDNYDYPWSARQMSSDNLSELECYAGSFYSIEASGSEVGDDEEVCSSYEVDANEELEENEDSGNELQAADDEVTTKLRELLDQMREMELKHQAVMEEMHQKQIAIMQSMIKMQGEYIQKVNEMQPQIDQLKGVPQKR